MTPEKQNECNNKMSFEEAFQALEGTAEALEMGNLTLAEATNLYEEGIKLAKLCNRLLNASELKINELKNSYMEEYDDDLA